MYEPCGKSFVLRENEKLYIVKGYKTLQKVKNNWVDKSCSCSPKHQSQLFCCSFCAIQQMFQLIKNKNFKSLQEVAFTKLLHFLFP